MAQRDSSLRRTDSVASGGEADMPRPLAPYQSYATDPTETLPARVCCDAQRGIVIGCNTPVEGTHETARFHHAARWRGGRRIVAGVSGKRSAVKLQAQAGLPFMAISGAARADAMNGS